MSVMLFLLKAVLVKFVFFFFSKILCGIWPVPTYAVLRNSRIELTDKETNENHKMENVQADSAHKRLTRLDNQRKSKGKKKTSKKEDNEAQTKTTRRGRIVQLPLRFRR